jgi:hypothetical protein
MERAKPPMRRRRCGMPGESSDSGCWRRDPLQPLDPSRRHPLELEFEADDEHQG